MKQSILLTVCGILMSFSTFANDTIRIYSNGCDDYQTFIGSHGGQLTMSANSDQWSHFVRWQDGNTDNPRTITTNGNADYTAYFEADKCLLASGTCGAQGDNLTWELSCDSVLTISGTGAMTDYSSSAPWYSSRSSITSVIISDGVTSIGDYAFRYCSSLTSVTIGNSVTSIGDYAFYGCSSLTSVTIPNSVTSIGEWAFNDCSSLTSVTIPNSVTSIGNYAFSGCSGLTSVTIGNSVTSIGEQAFYGCSSLTSVNVADDNPNYSSKDGVLFDKQQKKLILCPRGKQGAYVIPNSVTSIGDGAFSYCSGLTSVTIPNSVTSIGGGAFSGCSSLTFVTIPNSVTSIGSNAFAGCSGLTSVTIPNSVTSIGRDAFSGCSSMTSVTIPNSVTSIGDYVFSGCSSLTSVTIPNSVTSIGERAFYKCSSLTSVTIPNSVTSIGEWAFSGCSGLTSMSVEAGNAIYDSRDNCNAIIETESNTLIAGCKNTIIPNSVTSIGYYAFEGCSSLTSVTIPNSVTSIGDYAFYDCSGLTSVTNYATTPHTINNYVFLNVDKSIPLYVLAASIDTYKAADGWKEFTNILPIGGMDIDHPTNPGTYQLTLNASIADAGVLTGSGMYAQGTEVSVSATANTGYTFERWSDGVTDASRTITMIARDSTLTAIFSINRYTITFVDEDGTTVLSSDEYDYGATPVAPADPTKAATAQYTYTFAGWTPEVTAVTGDATYTATYSQTVNKYTVTFVDEDGTTVLASDEYDYGATPVAPADPIKAATAQYTYTFTGWTPEIAAVTGAATYTATYSQTVNKYTITFVDEDGTTVLASDEYEYGATPVVPADPTKAATAQYTYTFTGWSPAIAMVTGAATYTATYSQTVNKYTITFVDEDGTTVLASDEYEYGATPVAPATPTKAATAQYTYTFTGWTPEIVAVTGAATYKATYSQTVNKYTITFVDEDGTTVLASDEYEYGATPVAPANPTKAATEEYTYTFSGWDKTIAVVTEAATYTATYSSQLNNVAVTGDQDLADLPVGENTHITVGEDGNLTVSEPTTIGTITVTVNGDEASEITGVENLTVTNAEMILRLEPNKANATPNKWYAFGVPFEVEVSGGIYAQGSASPAIYNSAFVLDEYDGSLRASTQQGWKRVSSSAVLQPGVLYMIATGSTTNEWRFVKRASASLTEQTSLSVAAYPSAIGAHHAGWNGLANTLFRDASVVLDGVQYITTYNNEQSVYEVQPIADATLAMAKPFFVQVPQAGTLHLTAQPAGVAARSLMAADELTPSCVLSLSSADFTDRAYVTAQVGKENTYSIGHDLMKMLDGTPSVPQLWLEGYNLRLAAYELALTSESTTFIIPLGLYAPQNGTYTLDADTQSDYYTLTLLADDTPVAELGEQTVSIELEQGNNSKYALRITKKADVVTDIVNGTADGTQVVKFVQDDLLYILRDGKTYTIQGVEVK